MQDNTVLIFYQAKESKKDLRARFGELLEQFKDEAVNGSIQLHFSQGFLAKIHNTRVD